MHSREGLTQGEPLSMVAYILEVLSRIKNLKTSHYDITQPWYADNMGMLGMFVNIHNYFNYLTQAGLECRY